MILKELLGLSDETLIESIILDPRFPFAPHTTHFAEQPFSDETLQRFRYRCSEYAMETGIDLIDECLMNIAEVIAKAWKATDGMKRHFEQRCRDAGRCDPPDDTSITVTDSVCRNSFTGSQRKEI